MKFIHLSDLHLGKRLNEFSLIEDQEYILNKIINIIMNFPNCFLFILFITSFKYGINIINIR